MGENWKHGRCLTQLARISTVQGEYEQAQGQASRVAGSGSTPISRCKVVTQVCTRATRWRDRY